MQLDPIFELPTPLVFAHREVGWMLRRATCSLGLVSALGFACGGPPLPPRAEPTVPTVSPDGPIVVLGDTQRTSWPERLVGREQNELARRELIQKLADEERPAFVVHLGDMVEAGTEGNWEYFDHLVSPLTARQIPIFPVLGNHDYGGDPEKALQLARQHFPQLGPTGWYARRHRGLGLVWLDSNATGAAAHDQAVWFSQMLVAFEHDEATRAVIVFTHHPPYTNGKHRCGDDYVREQLLPTFQRASKAVALMSGHVHGYERFQVNDKTFVVTGGGGGPRVSYHLARKDEPPPAYVTADGRPRAFNYVVMYRLEERLEFAVKCLALDAVCDGGVLERFSVSMPRAGGG